MNQAEIDILKQYLSDDEIKQIVIDEYKSVIREEIKLIQPNKRMDDYERVIGNAVYYFIQKEADTLIGGDVSNIISEKVKNVINSADYSYNVFRKKSVWEKEDSLAQNILNEAVIANKGLIYSKVEEQINALDIAQIKDMIIDSTVAYLTEKFNTNKITND